MTDSSRLLVMYSAPVFAFSCDSVTVTSALRIIIIILASCAGGRHNMPPSHVALTFDLLTLKVVSQSHLTWATSVSVLVFLGLAVLD